MIVMKKAEYDRRVEAGEFILFSDISGRFPNMNGRRAFFCHIPEHDCCGLLVEGVGFIVEGEEDKWPNPTKERPLTASGIVSGMPADLVKE